MKSLSVEKDTISVVLEEEENVGNPFFIISCPRSGSSLLSRMLDAHPRLAVPFESHLFNTFYPWLKYYGDLKDQGATELLIQDILSTDVMRDWHPSVDKASVLSMLRVRSFGGVVDAIMRSWAKTQNKQRWGDKTPEHVFYSSNILECFPNSKFIHIVRDGRDVAISLIRARFGPKTVYSAARRWESYLNEIEKLKRSISPSSFFQLHYEDLLHDPQKILADVCEFLGEEFKQEMLEFYRNTAPYNTDQTNF